MILSRFAQDRRGVAAVEFALLAPLMVLTYFGMAELTSGLMANRKVTAVASTIGDLTAQTQSINPAQVTDIFSIGQTIMQPYPVTGTSLLRMRVSSVTVDANGSPKVDWSRGTTGLTALTKGSVMALPLAAKAKSTDPDSPFIGAGQSVIVAEAHYAFTSPVAQYLPKISDMHDTLYLSPRQGPAVTCPAC
jgi:Flp pilus assembly protein TadG